MPTQAKKKVLNHFDRNKVGFKPRGKSMTEQHHAKECDINTIMLRYEKTGVLTHIKKYEPTYGDVSDVDFKRALDTVSRVKTEFEELPAYVRAEYKNDVSQYLADMQTPEGVAHLQNILHPGEKYDKYGRPDDPGETEHPGTPAPELPTGEEGDS